MIEITDLNVSYGEIKSLRDVSITADREDRVVAILGSNGAGKSTLLKTMSGILRPDSGSVKLFGEEITRMTPRELVELGFVHVPEERHLFGHMSVRENLEMGGYLKKERFEFTVKEVFELFPVLEERQGQEARTLSGGEQQMLAIGRGLMSEPEILALDEPTGALAPHLVQDLFTKIEEISRDVNVFLVEQRANAALEIADKAFLLENGRITGSGTGAELQASDSVKEAYLSG